MPKPGQRGITEKLNSSHIRFCRSNLTEVIITAVVGFYRSNPTDDSQTDYPVVCLFNERCDLGHEIPYMSEMFSNVYRMSFYWKSPAYVQPLSLPLLSIVTFTVFVGF
jgi:hypothetical protein